MTPRSFLLTEQLGDYVRASSEPPDDVVRDLLAETAALAADPRWETVLLPVSDGLTFLRRR